MWCLVKVCRVLCSSGAVLLHLVAAEGHRRSSGTNRQISIQPQITVDCDLKTYVKLLLHVGWQPLLLEC